MCDCICHRITSARTMKIGRSAVASAARNSRRKTSTSAQGQARRRVVMAVQAVEVAVAAVPVHQQQARSELRTPDREWPRAMSSSGTAVAAVTQEALPLRRVVFSSSRTTSPRRLCPNAEVTSTMAMCINPCLDQRSPTQDPPAITFPWRLTRPKCPPVGRLTSTATHL